MTVDTASLLPLQLTHKSTSNMRCLQLFKGVFTASVTAAPKTGTTVCYIQIFSQQGCDITLQNQYHSFPFDGVIMGSTVECAALLVQSYGGLQIVCG